MENCNVNQSGIEQYQAENQAIGEYVLQKYFFDDFKVGAKNEFGKNMEIIVSPVVILVVNIVMFIGIEKKFLMKAFSMKNLQLII